MKIEQRQDVIISSRQLRSRRWDVKIPTGPNETLIIAADITYVVYPDLDDQKVFNPKDISIDDGDVEQYDAIVAEITKQLKAEGFNETPQRFT